MKKRSVIRFAVFFFAASILAWAAAVPAADVVTTLKDELRVEGEILSENEDEVVISTEYGDLRFLKINLKSIERDVNSSGGSSSSSASDYDPFGAPDSSSDSSGDSDPFGGGSDAFGAGDSGNSSSSGDPFGPPSSAGDSGSSSSDPFGGGELSQGGSGSSSSNPFGSGGSSSASGERGFGGYGIPMSEIQGGSGSAAPGSGNSSFGGGSNNPFGAPSGTGNSSGSQSDNPFSSDASSPGSNSPFGGMGEETAQESAGSGDPFATAESGGSGSSGPAEGSANPFAFEESGGSSSSSGSNPFASGGSAPVRRVAARAQDRATGSPAGDEQPASESAPKMPSFPTSFEAPTVESGFDAVVYGINEAFPVEVKLASASAWDKAMDAKQLQTGTEIRTRETPTSRLMLRDKRDELRLPKESHIEIALLSDDSEEVVIDLKAGSIWSEVSPRSKPDAFQIRTPELTAGVRGTNFRVDRSSGFSKVSVFEGKVHVTANRTGTFVTLEENQSAVVNLHGQIMELLAVPTDEQQIYGEWEQWAMETTAGSGSLAGYGPVGSLSQQVAQDNARWEKEMQDYMRNMAEIRYQDKLEEYAGAFLQYAADTGHVPESEEGWSLLKFDDGRQGWNGPYVEGPVPPLDPWKRALVYKKVVSPTGRVFGRVYSLWQDGRDQGGVNSSVDKLALIRYYDLERFENDPEINPNN